jgi:hypothetical protein
MHGPDVRFSWHFFCITFAGIWQDSCRSFNYLERACPSLFAFERKFASFLGAHIPLPNCISQRLSQRLYCPVLGEQPNGEPKEPGEYGGSRNSGGNHTASGTSGGLLSPAEAADAVALKRAKARKAEVMACHFGRVL